ncbi:ATPase, T2SS/T4P/T4SS family [Acidovorax sp.]|uniref:GspE/PulE family protein n=1 Tax=Acidovorax sp. TaxID=1872122 RepID=UPI0025BFE42C|nr:ATPase, T2SS/T4P/T4SS family [Acidovorax sp.]
MFRFSRSSANKFIGGAPAPAPGPAPLIRKSSSHVASEDGAAAAVQRVVAKAQELAAAGQFLDSVPLASADEPETRASDMGAPSMSVAEPKPENQPAGIPQESTLISDINKVPVGRYFPLGDLHLKGQVEWHFALVETGPKILTMLVTPEQENGHMRFDLRKRVTERGFTMSKQMLASKELIRAFHARNAPKSESATAQTDLQVYADALIEQAFDAGASDIHIETREQTYAKVYFRIHGKRVPQSDIAYDTASAMGSTLYTVEADSSSKSTNWSKDLICDGAIDKKMKNGTRIQVRFHSAPIHPAGNFHIVMRILRMDAEASQPVEKIGYTEKMVQALEEIIIGAQGLVILVGPTNSGKSTTLQSLIRRIYQRRGDNTKIITVEDPVEYTIANACQMGVSKGRKDLLDDGKGSVFEKYLAASLRADPDVLMVGEVRTNETASMVKDMVLAGRKILTTIHAYEALAVFPRLRELGVPESVLYMDGFISGVVYQRLVPVMCPHCSLSFQEGVARGLVHAALKDRVDMVCDHELHNVRVASPDGCEHCNGQGIIGRTICAEVLVPDRQLLHSIRSGDPVEIQRAWEDASPHAIEDLGVSAMAHAIHKMRKGMLDPNDVESQIGRIRVARVVR